MRSNVNYAKQVRAKTERHVVYLSAKRIYERTTKMIRGNDHSKGMNTARIDELPFRFQVLFILVLLALISVSVFPGCASIGGDRKFPEGKKNKVEKSGAQSEKPWSFIVCGDPQNNYEVFSRVTEAAKSVEFLIVAGDITGSGTEQEFKTFSSFMAQKGVRFYAIPGNHDVARAPPDTLFAKYVGKPSQSFSHKNCFFVLIDNSSSKKGFYKEERERVKKDLQAARTRDFDHFIAICHVPPGYPYSLMMEESERSAMANNDYLVPLLEEFGVKELFCGHFHAFRQYKEDGLRITITGGAGAPLHASERNGGYYHYLLLKVSGKKLEIRVVRI